MQRRAFTLVELLVVIAIIGILVSLTAASWSAVASRGRDSTRKSDLARLKQILQQYYAERRTYPAFDTLSGGEVILGSGWQLEANTIGCAHSPGKNLNTRLTPKYMRKIPHDPQDGTNYLADGCKALENPQMTRYLYLSSPSAQSTGPSTTPDGFGLMTTLERPGNDLIGAAQNPLQNPNTSFGNWYSYIIQRQGIRLNANYLITNKN